MEGKGNTFDLIDPDLFDTAPLYVLSADNSIMIPSSSGLYAVAEELQERMADINTRLTAMDPIPSSLLPTVRGTVKFLFLLCIYFILLLYVELLLLFSLPILACSLILSSFYSQESICVPIGCLVTLSQNL